MTLFRPFVNILLCFVQSEILWSSSSSFVSFVLGILPGLLRGINALGQMGNDFLFLQSWFFPHCAVKSPTCAHVRDLASPQVCCVPSVQWPGSSWVASHLPRAWKAPVGGLAQSRVGLQAHSSLTRASDTEKMASTCWPLASLQYLGVYVAAEVWLDLVLRYSM